MPDRDNLLTAREARGILLLALLTLPVADLSDDEVVVAAAALQAIKEPLEERGKELRPRLLTLARAEGEANDSGKTFTYTTEHAIVAATARTSAEVDAAAVRKLLEEKEIPLGGVFPTTGLTVLPPKGVKEIPAEVWPKVREALPQGYTLRQERALNEKALQGLVALELLTTADLTKVTKTTVTDMLKVTPTDELLTFILRKD